MYPILSSNLRARSAFPEFMSSDPFFADSLSRAICFVISENLLTIIPDIDDYTCPVCASITYKPGRNPLCYSVLISSSAVGMRSRLLHSLSSYASKATKIKLSHLSCKCGSQGGFRYLIQRVLSHRAENIDESLLNFLKMYFPRETKAKQLENEKAAGMDQLTAVGLGKSQGNCVIT